MRRLLASALLACVCLGAAPRLARADDAVTAEALFRAGRDAMRSGDFAAACAKFDESYALDRAPGTLLNLGECKANLGLFASSWQRYREAADLLAGDARREIALKGIQDVEPRVPYLTVDIPANAPPSTRVRRDKTPLGRASLGVAIPIDPGDHVVVLEADGHAPSEVKVHLEPADKKTIALTVGKEILAPVPHGSPLRPLGFVLAGVGVAGLGVGVATGVLTINRKNTVDQQCDRGVCKAPGLAAASDGKTFSAVSTVTFVAGTALLGLGVVLAIVGHPTLDPPAATGGVGRRQVAFDSEGLKVVF